MRTCTRTLTHVHTGAFCGWGHKRSLRQRGSRGLDVLHVLPQRPGLRGGGGGGGGSAVPLRRSAGACACILCLSPFFSLRFSLLPFPIASQARIFPACSLSFFGARRFPQFSLRACMAALETLVSFRARTHALIRTLPAPLSHPPPLPPSPPHTQAPGAASGNYYCYYPSDPACASAAAGSAASSPYGPAPAPTPAPAPNTYGDSGDSDDGASASGDASGPYGAPQQVRWARPFVSSLSLSLLSLAVPAVPMGPLRRQSSLPRPSLSNGSLSLARPSHSGYTRLSLPPPLSSPGRARLSLPPPAQRVYSPLSAPGAGTLHSAILSCVLRTCAGTHIHTRVSLFTLSALHEAPLTRTHTHLSLSLTLHHRRRAVLRPAATTTATTTPATPRAPLLPLRRPPTALRPRPPRPLPRLRLRLRPPGGAHTTPRTPSARRLAAPLLPPPTVLRPPRPRLWLPPPLPRPAPMVPHRRLPLPLRPPPVPTAPPPPRRLRLPHPVLTSLPPHPLRPPPPPPGGARTTPPARAAR